MGISVPSPVISSGRTAFMIVSETARNGQKAAKRTPEASWHALQESTNMISDTAAARKLIVIFANRSTIIPSR